MYGNLHAVGGKRHSRTGRLLYRLLERKQRKNAQFSWSSCERQQVMGGWIRFGKMGNGVKPHQAGGQQGWRSPRQESLLSLSLSYQLASFSAGSGRNSTPS